MEIFWDLLINLTSAFLGFFICRVYYKFKKTLQLKLTRYFWKPFVNGEKTLVIIGHIEELNYYERSGVIGFGDAVALAELKSYFDSMNIKNVHIEYDKKADGDALKSNLVLLGGPQTNVITEKVLSEIYSTLEFGSGSSVAICDTKENKTYTPSVSYSEEVSVDYGMIVKAKNPYDHSKNVVVIAGSWGYGTWAGVRLSISKDLDKMIHSLGFDSFECLLKSDIVLKTPQNIDAVCIREVQLRM